MKVKQEGKVGDDMYFESGSEETGQAGWIAMPLTLCLKIQKTGWMIKEREGLIFIFLDNNFVNLPIEKMEIMLTCFIPKYGSF